MEWIECPTCHTGYRTDKIGVVLDRTQQITIACQVCKVPFNANVTVTTTWEQKSRWNPIKEEVTHKTVETSPRVA